MFGGLYIKTACFKILSDILRDSEWTCAPTEADIATPRMADAVHVNSNVIRNRHAHQITACSLLELIMPAVIKA